MVLPCHQEHCTRHNPKTESSGYVIKCQLTKIASLKVDVYLAVVLLYFNCKSHLPYLAYRGGDIWN